MLKQSTLQDSAHQAEDGFQKAEASASQLSGKQGGQASIWETRGYGQGCVQGSVMMRSCRRFLEFAL